ncbi:DUF732 domain-containing protein [Streptomyces liangshanensis]|uniref:DUF732 domain-containing protein n=1 Tax=Streptomyces liangshanensis TaxID=2717324 RepID=UPI0036D8D3E6
MVVLVAVLAGCSAGPAVEAEREPTETVDRRGAVLLEAVTNPENLREVSAFSEATPESVAQHAEATCDDLRAAMPMADVWRNVMERDGIDMFDADYFTRASAKLYCPRYQREAGYL